MMANPPNNTIFQYVRNRRREKVGVVVALKRNDNKVGFGYSLCAVNKGDNFDPTRGLEIAIGRANAFPHFVDEIPSSAYADMQIIYNRATRYFKDAEIV